MPEGSVICDACGAPSVARGGVCAFCGAALPRVAAPPPAPPMRDRARPAGRVETYCPQCGVLYPADAQACPRCPPVVGDPKGGRCPRCAHELVPEARGDVTIDRCGSCGGMWFDVGEVGRVLDLTTEGLTKEQVDDVQRRLADRLPVAYAADPSIACVRCGKRMDRRTVAPRSRILVDFCKPHGMWFDQGEFEALSAFVEADGLEILREWEDLVRKNDARKPRVRLRHRLADEEPIRRSDVVRGLVVGALLARYG